jgi:hypothetical protein
MVPVLPDPTSPGAHRLRVVRHGSSSLRSAEYPPLCRRFLTTRRAHVKLEGKATCPPGPLSRFVSLTPLLRLLQFALS